MKTCDSEYLGYCLVCGLSCKEVEVCSETIVCLSKDSLNNYNRNWINKSLKERYEEIEQLQNIK